MKKRAKSGQKTRTSEALLGETYTRKSQESLVDVQRVTKYPPSFFQILQRDVESIRQIGNVPAQGRLVVGQHCDVQSGPVVPQLFA